MCGGSAISNDVDELDASSTTIAATTRTHVVDRRVNNFRAVNPSDPTLIEPVDVDELEQG